MGERAQSRKRDLGFLVDGFRVGLEDDVLKHLGG